MELPHVLSLKYHYSLEAESALGLYSPKMQHSALATVSILKALAELNSILSKFPFMFRNIVLHR